MFSIVDDLYLNTGAKILACLLCVLVVSAQEDTTTNNESSSQLAGSDDGVSTASSIDASTSISTSASDDADTTHSIPDSTVSDTITTDLATSSSNTADTIDTTHSIPDSTVSDTITTDIATSSSNTADKISTDDMGPNKNTEASTDTTMPASGSSIAESSTDTTGMASSSITTEFSTDTSGKASSSITTGSSTDTNESASGSITADITSTNLPTTSSNTAVTSIDDTVQCRPGTFNLQESHDTGCIKCYCSGISKICSLQYYPVTQFTVPIHQVELVEIRMPISTEGLNIKKLTEITNVSTANESHHELYWSLPSDLLSGNKIGSYGNYLNWTQGYESELNSSADTTPKLVIISTDNTVLTWIDSTPLLPNQSKALSVQLNEKDLKKENEDVRHSISREEVMRVLSSIKSILIRHPHSSQPSAASVSNITMGVVLDHESPTDPSNDPSQATLLESCSCPKNYSGKSCESCAEKFYREKANYTDLGICIPCPCNGNERQCFVSPNSTEVICICSANFTGRNCEERIEPPKMIQGPSNTTTQENEELILSCTAANTSATNIRWEFIPATHEATTNKSSAASTIEKRFYKANDFRQDYEYKIARVSKKDEGWYTCIIFNNMGTVSATAYLTVAIKTEKDSTVGRVATGCLKVATALLSFLCVMVMIPIVLLWVLDRRAKQRSKRRMEVAS